MLTKVFHDCVGKSSTRFEIALDPSLASCILNTILIMLTARAGDIINM